MTWPVVALVLGGCALLIAAYATHTNHQLRRMRETAASLRAERGLVASETIARSVGETLDTHALALKNLRLKVEALQGAVKR